MDGTLSKEELQKLAHSQDIQLRLAELISAGDISERTAELLALQLVGGTSVEEAIGVDRHGEVDMLLVADSSINRSALATRLRDLSPNGQLVDGQSGTRAGLIGADSGSGVSEGPVLDENVGNLIIQKARELSNSEQTAFQEVLDGRSFSLSTANVRETVDASGAYLFIGVPKYGHFDEYEPYSGQIDYHPTLVSGVDLVVIEAPADTQTIRPPVDALDGQTAVQLIKFARQITPDWEDESRELKDGIIDTFRNHEQDTDGGLSLSPERLSEALRKLSEATTRLRLSDTVSKSDVKRSYGLLRDNYDQMRIELEPADGFDADIDTEGGTGDAELNRHIKSVRRAEQASNYTTDIEKAGRVKCVIASLEDSHDEGAPEDLVIERASAAHNLSLDSAEQYIEDLKVFGEAYEPRTNHLRTT